MKKIFYFMVALATFTASAQVGIGVPTANIDASAQLEVASTTKGFLAPRMTEAQKNAITSPAAGLLVYQTDAVTGFYYFDGSVWKNGLGPQGPQGEIGMIGEKGEKGDQGPQGIPGETGPAGTPADLSNYVTNDGLTTSLNDLTNLVDLGYVSKYDLTNTLQSIYASKQSVIDLSSSLDDKAPKASPTFAGTATADGFKTPTGTAVQFLKADGSLDSNTYLTAATAGSNFVDVTTAQTVAGAKTFNSDLIVNGLTIGKGSGSVSSNTSLGNANLVNNTTGGWNTSVGSGVLFFNTTGNNNSGMGFNALSLNTTGANNTAVGTSSLYSNTTGNTNTAIGVSSLEANTTGSNNTAIGINSLGLNTSGIFNTAIGTSSLVANTTGTRNVALGSSSLSKNSEGSSNTAIGNSALLANVTGTYNTALGFQSNVASSALTNATAIGYTAIVDSSNKIQLGNANVTSVNTSATITGAGFKTPLGTSSQYLMADGTTSSASNASITVGAIPAASNPFGASITSGVLYLAPADANNPGIITQSTQTIGGSKTFSKDLNVNGLTIGKGAGNISNNTAIGISSLGANTTGTRNVALGVSSLAANTTGTNNTAIGNSTLATNVDGTYNTAVGFSANVASSNLTNATAIGYNAKVDDSNKIQLGNTDVTSVNTSATITGAGFKTPLGTSSQYLMADGSVSSAGATADLSGYATTAALVTVETQVAQSTSDISALSSSLNNKAPIVEPTFAGTATAEGFKTPTGTSSQYLMADGTVSSAGATADLSGYATTTALDTEVARALAAENVLYNFFSGEETRAITREDNLNNDILNETSRAKTAEDVLNNSLNNLSQNVSYREDSFNKSTDINLGDSDVLFPTQNATKTYVDSKIAAIVTTGGAALNEAADEITASSSQTIFTLTQTPAATSRVKMYINGIRISNAAYIVSGTTLMYDPANNGNYSISDSDRIQFDYSY